MSLTAIIVQIVIALVLAVISYMMAPKPHTPRNDATKGLDSPTADASRPITVVFGKIRIKAPNCLYSGDVSQETKKVKA